jgi:Ser/Thr protein kinase RdoA (MazF antagonist)
MQPDSVLMKKLVEELYVVRDVELHSMSQYDFDWRGIYCVEHGGGVDWVFRVCRQDGPTNWYIKPVAVLLFLEQQNYTAPRVVRTLSGELTGTCKGWWTFMTTFVEGSLVDYSTESLYALGRITGKLHALSPEAAAAIVPPVQASWKQPQETVPECLRLLTQVDDHIPPELRSFCDEVRASLERIEDAAKSLPETVIHGDCWPGNVVRTTDGEVVLVDWDGAGFGPPVLDVGSLLLTCHFNQPNYPSIQPDVTSIEAIVEGYCQERLLTADEVAVLEDAVRFNSAFHFTRGVEAILQGEWPEDIGLQKLRIRFEVAEEVAQVARGCFEQLI